MSRFLLVNLNDHKPEEDEPTFIQYSQYQCVCCLEKDTKLVGLAQCSHFSILQDLIKFKMESECSHICYLCHGILKNIGSFQKQVETSYMYLTDVSLSNCSTNFTQNTRLKCYTLEPIIINTENRTSNGGKNPNDPLSATVKSEMHVDWSHNAIINGDSRTASEDHSMIVLAKSKLGSHWDDEDVKDEHSLLKDSPYNSDAADVSEQNELTLMQEETMGRDTCVKKLRKHKHSLQRKVRKKRKCNGNKEIDELGSPVATTALSGGEVEKHYKHHSSAKSKKTGKRVKRESNSTTSSAADNAKLKKLYKCDVCDKISSTKDAHRYHKSTHRSRVECAECDKTFSHRAAMINHTQGVHNLKAVFKCSDCDKVFKWKTSLKKHSETHERKGQPPPAATCATCEVSFSSVCSYRRHMRNSLRHTTKDQLKFTCDHCERRYVNKTKLRDHIEEKHLHRTYQCHICLKPSKNRVCLDQHIRNLHRGRPLDKICHHCGKGFPTNIQLESHIRSHTGERPFICQHCPSTFSHQSNLYKHNRQVHLNIKPKRCAISRRPKELEQAAAQQVAPPADSNVFASKTIAVPLVLQFEEGKSFLV